MARRILHLIAGLVFCFGIMVSAPALQAQEDGAGGKWDWKKKQIYELDVYQIKPPQGVGSQYSLKIGQSGKTTEFLGNVTNSATVTGGTYVSPTITGPTLTTPIITSTPSTSTSGTIALTSAMSGKIFYQSTGIDQEYDLPADPTGCIFHFIKDGTTTEFRFDPNGTDTIISALGSSTAGDYYASITAYATITIVGLNTSTWMVQNWTGSWADQ